MVINIAAFLCAHQKIEIFKLSYAIRTKELTASNFVDQNAQLRYNVARIKSPEHIENILVASSKGSEFVRDRKVVIARLSPAVQPGSGSSGKIQTLVRFHRYNIFDVLLGGAEAEAQIK
ncbi:MAG: hypothetical protein JW844_06920 [Candidatus Omnitrophica bacterium]|nr:hypothetical protein [Candidatus Omnitrophota bacterium]